MEEEKIIVESFNDDTPDVVEMRAGDFNITKSTSNTADEQTLSADDILNFSEYKGRKQISVAVDEITQSNVLQVIEAIAPAFESNIAQSQYLMDYYLGEQEVLKRSKRVRPEINNKMVENRAAWITDFKLGYQYGNGVFYTSRPPRGVESESLDLENSKRITNSVDDINTINGQIGKKTADMEHLLDVLVIGKGFRFVKVEDNDHGYAISALSGINSDMVYTSDAIPKQLGYIYFSLVTDIEGNEIERYTVYTPNEVIVVDDESINTDKSHPHTLGVIPVVETKLNKYRVGIFEPVLGLLEAINIVQSDRINGIEQFIQALLVLENIDIDEEEYQKLRSEGGVSFTSTPDRKASIKYLTNELNQSGAQLLKNDLLGAVGELTAMPSRESVGGGTGDTGAAVELRDGWAAAETHAKTFDPYLYDAERQLVHLITICYNMGEGRGSELKASDIEVKYNRNPRNDRYTAIQSMIEEINAGIDVRVAIASANVYADPELVVESSIEDIIRIRDGNKEMRENSANTDNTEGERTPIDSKTQEVVNE